MTHPEHLRDGDADKLHRLRERDPEVDRLTGHVRKFAVMMTARHGDRLEEWIAGVEQQRRRQQHHLKGRMGIHTAQHRHACCQKSRRRPAHSSGLSVGSLQFDNHVGSHAPQPQHLLPSALTTSPAVRPMSTPMHLQAKPGPDDTRLRRRLRVERCLS